MALKIESTAYLKLLLHAFKYPSAPVSGVVLLDAKEPSLIVDAIPLFHSHILAPMLELSLLQVEAFAATQGLAIGGFYYGNESLLEKEVPAVAAKIATKIQTNASVPTALILLDNEALVGKEGAVLEAGVVFTSDSKSGGSFWVRSSVLAVNDAESIAGQLKTQISSGAYLSLADFDGHLADPTQDWTNSLLLGNRSAAAKKNQ